MWEYNRRYQAPIQKAVESTTEPYDLRDAAVFDACLGKDEHYFDFLQFFRQEIGQRGMPEVVHHYMLKGDARADDIFCRMYTDLVHPMIHLGCGIEFQQPSIVAEALASACIHDNWPKRFLLPAESFARGIDKDAPSATILEVIAQLREDAVIASAVHADDPFNKIADGLLARLSGQEFAPHLGQYRVEETAADIQRKTNEMMQASAFVMAAAQRPGKRTAMDFVLLHNVTLAAFYPAIMSLEWLSNRDKARLLGAKVRVDAVMYAGCGCPELFPSAIQKYRPLQPQSDWQALFHRANIFRDEGHAAKLVRALYCAYVNYDESENVRTVVARHDLFVIANMAMDSIEQAHQPGGSTMPHDRALAVAGKIGNGGDMVVGNMTRWVFYNGLPGAWDFVPNADNSKADAKSP